MAGGNQDWKAPINHQSSLLTETKNLIGKTDKLIEESNELLKESRSQSKQNKWILLLATLTLLASIVLPFLVK